MKPLEQLKVHLFPPVTQSMALDIARQALAQPVVTTPLICYGRRPANFNIYGDLPEPCWWVMAPWNDKMDKNVIRSRRVIAIGRVTGTILYDGSAGDEG
jgi:hypothetical protein